MKKQDGIGIGDNIYSYAVDGCRKVLWHNGIDSRIEHLEPWKSGKDI